MYKLLVVFLLLTNYSHAQKWSLRVTLNHLHTGSNVVVKSWTGNKNLTKVFPYNEGLTGKEKFKRFFKHPFWEISVIKSINSKHAVSVGYLNLWGYVNHSIEAMPKNNVGSIKWSLEEGQDMPALRFNYHYTYSKPQKTDVKMPFSVQFFAGILLNFRGKEGSTFSTGGKLTSIHVDANNNPTDTVFIYRKNIGAKRPMPPTPTLNLGANGNLKLGKRISAGINITGYLGYKSLFTHVFEGKTNDAEFTYEVKLKPYFFSSAIYLQYTF
ncbi:MAG: hypothetical protein F9K23_03975 [Bacteroidetes bacterium]|nr:MAG: hypothetical protein F9K23_03975 [Bacteroidota bacterium]